MALRSGRKKNSSASGHGPDGPTRLKRETERYSFDCDKKDDSGRVHRVANELTT